MFSEFQLFKRVARIAVVQNVFPLGLWYHVA
jgi:hypothetical protein